MVAAKLFLVSKESVWKAKTPRVGLNCLPVVVTAAAATVIACTILKLDIEISYPNDNKRQQQQENVNRVEEQQHSMLTMETGRVGWIGWLVMVRS